MALSVIAPAKAYFRSYCDVPCSLICVTEYCNNVPYPVSFEIVEYSAQCWRVTHRDAMSNVYVHFGASSDPATDSCR